MRRSEGNRERFISLYDDPEAPTNYLEVSYSPLDAEAAAAAVSEALSGDYELAREERVLDGAGRCIHIQTTAAKGGGLPTQLQERYIVPASDGSRIAALHYSFEAAEGFGRRFAYMLNSLTVTERSGAALLSDEEITWKTWYGSCGSSRTRRPSPPSGTIAIAAIRIWRPW